VILILVLVYLVQHVSLYVGSPADVIGPGPTFRLYHLMVWLHR